MTIENRRHQKLGHYVWKSWVGRTYKASTDAYLRRIRPLAVIEWLVRLIDSSSTVSVRAGWLTDGRRALLVFDHIYIDYTRCD